MSEQPASSSAEKWDAPLFEGMDGSGFLTASQLQDVQQQAYEEARSEGYEEGLAAGKAELERRMQRLDELLASLAAPYEQLDESVEQQLVKLAMTVASQLFRRELSVDRSHVVGVVRDALKLLPDGSREVTVVLHPDDSALVEELLTSPEGERAWSIVEDPLIERGGCKVRTESSQVDARNEKRLEEVLQSICGEES